MIKLNLNIGQSVKSLSDNYYKVVSNLGSGGNSTVFFGALHFWKNERNTFFVKDIL